VRLAIITCAGWKGASSEFPDIEPGVPESLLPLGNGDTLLSRQARQLRELDFMVFAAIGQPGSTFPWWGQHQSKHRHITVEGAQEGIVESPWTWPRVAYVAKHAIPLFVPDPDGISRHGTNCLAIEALGCWGWDQLLLTGGDHLNTTELLQEIVSMPCPCQVILAGHVWFWLTPESARLYRDLTPRYRGARIWYRQDCLAAKLFAGVVPQFRMTGYGEQFVDVDGAVDYRNALQWFQERG